MKFKHLQILFSHIVQKYIKPDGSKAVEKPSAAPVPPKQVDAAKPSSMKKTSSEVAQKAAAPSPPEAPPSKPDSAPAKAAGAEAMPQPAAAAK